ncbi:MAG: D-alanine--D-alanine ligase [Desulfobacterales bacterium CG23_combo_of_CG06-09_8_20_14_all_52_9]|nr:MAG: D-alanine--D-alanine ligase [Desulfobacterales bacterium CG23_combo_of_CG06-09_8_20_14_all_52_9]
MNVVIVHAAVTDDSAPDDRDVLDQVDAVSAGLKGLGHTVTVLPCHLDLAGVKSRLLAVRPRVVFNLVESLDGCMRLIHLFPALLEAMALPYTGSCAEALWVTTHKGMAKAKISAAGLPTPPWVLADEGHDTVHDRPSRLETNTIRKPWIIKSLWEHASVGLDEDRIVSMESFQELSDRLQKIFIETGDPCFAEAYIDGREFNLSVLGGPGGPQVLSPAEIVFEGYADEKPKIVGYKAKWEPGSWEYHHTPRSFDFPDTDQSLLNTLNDLALSCWKIFGLKGYARIDFRVDSKGRPWILEVNANPCLSPDAGFSAALKRSGISFIEAIGRILADALRRGF